jgi:hypothetical protein
MKVRSVGPVSFSYGLTLLVMRSSIVCQYFRSYKLVKYYSRKPLGDIINTYYPPLKMFNSLLLRLRYLGFYHDDHLVSIIVRTVELIPLFKT